MFDFSASLPYGQEAEWSHFQEPSIKFSQICQGKALKSSSSSLRVFGQQLVLFVLVKPVGRV